MQTAARTLIGSTVISGFFFQSSQLDFFISRATVVTCLTFMSIFHFCSETELRAEPKSDDRSKELEHGSPVLRRTGECPRLKKIKQPGPV